MAIEDYFSIVTGLGVRVAERSTVFPYSGQQWRKFSTTSSNSSCNSISTSSSDSFTTTQAADFKASILCADRGTVPGFKPIGDEWCYLGVDQRGSDEVHCSFLQQPMEKQGRQKCSQMKRKVHTEASSFAKREVPRRNTSSLLTGCLSMESHKGSMGSHKRSILAGLRCEDLPSAFDEDEGTQISELLDTLPF
jgi:hypothetical protein